MNTYSNLDPSNVFVFSHGESKNLENISTNNISEIDKIHNPNIQIEELMNTINNLGKTVNRNALFLKNLSDEVTQKINTDELGVLLDYISSNNNILEDFFTKKQNHSLDKKNSGAFFPKTVEKLNNFLQKKDQNLKQKNNKLEINSIINLNVKLNKELMCEISENYIQNRQFSTKIQVLEEKIDSLTKLTDNDSQIKNCFKKFGELESSLVKQIGECLLKSDTLFQNIEKLNKGKDELEIKLKNEMKFLSQKVNDSHKVISSQAELKNPTIDLSKNELIGKYLELQEFKEFRTNLEKSLSQINEKIKNFDFENINNLYLKLNGLSDSVIKKLKNSTLKSEVEAKYKKKEIIDENFKKLNEFEKKIFLLEEFKKEDQEKMKNFQFQISKNEKNISRLEFQIKTKVNREVYEADMLEKFSKTEFYDFNSTISNLPDKLKEYYNEFLIEKSIVRSKFETLDKSLQNSTQNFSKENQKLNKKTLNNEILDQNSILLLFKNLNRDIEQKINFLTKRFEESKNNLIDIVNYRLISLTTTKQLNCLSCGSQNVNYPPIIIHQEGIDKKIYLQELEEQKPNINSLKTNQKIEKSSKSFLISKSGVISKTALKTEINKSEVETTIKNVDNEKASFLTKSRLMSAKAPLLRVQKHYITGEDVFNKEFVVKEHLRKMHGLENDGRDVKMEKVLRPFSSVPKRYSMNGN